MDGTENELLNHIKSRKLRYFGHVMRQPHDNVEGSVMVGLVKGVRNDERQRMCWLDSGLVYQVITCYTSWETEGVGHHWLIHAANHCKATMARWHDITNNSIKTSNEKAIRPYKQQQLFHAHITGQTRQTGSPSEELEDFVETKFHCPHALHDSKFRLKKKILEFYWLMLLALAPYN